MADPTDQATPLGQDDYQQLYDMHMSSDPSVRVQGQAIAKKLTPDEQHEFYVFQQNLNKGKGERTRVDNTIGGVPPELAAAAIAPIGAALTSGGGLLARVTSGVQSAVGTAAPYVKYRAAQSMMRAMGVPEPIAEPIAWVVAGYRRGASAAPAVAAAPEVAAPKMMINSVDFNRINSLKAQGIPEGEAVRTVMNLRARGGQ